MFSRALNKIVRKYVLWHLIALKESLLTVEVIIQPPSDSHSFLFVNVELCPECLAQALALNLLLWMETSFYGFRMPSQRPWKLLAVLIVASAMLGAVGWQETTRNQSH